MNFLFRQGQYLSKGAYSVLNSFGIDSLFLKSFSFKNDGKSVIKKRHYHTNFEIHIIEKGFQIYEFDTEMLSVNAGELLFIPPMVKHKAIKEDAKTVKYAFTFKLRDDSLLASVENKISYTVFNTPSVITENIRYISAEQEAKKPYSLILVENRILECIVHLFRKFGAVDTLQTDEDFTREDPRVSLVKQYVEDNIFRNITVAELATYCYISEKHLERIFLQNTGCTLMEFVRQRKCREIEKLLSDSSLSIKEISKMMNFSNEYYFNSFFKKNAGMPPGAYRKTVLK